MRAKRSTHLTFMRPNGIFKTVPRDKCESWVATHFTFSLEVVVDGEVRHRDIKTPMAPGECHDNEPMLFRTPKGEWFHRVPWHEGDTRKPWVTLYREATREAAYEWLKQHGHEIPEPAIGITARERCLGICMEYVLAGETAPSVQEIARRARCHPGTAYKALKGLDRFANHHGHKQQRT
jgi:hypothetical protein